MARFAAITALAFVLSRALGLVRDVVIAQRFGTRSELDAYTLAFTVPDQLFILISGGALSAAFIPVFTQLLDSGDEERAQRMAAGVFGMVAVVVTLLVAISWVFAPEIVNRGVASQSSNPETRRLAVNLMRILLLSPLMLSLASVATALLQSYDEFTIPALAPIAYNTCIILGALLLAPVIGIQGVAIGVMIGSFFFLASQLPAARRRGLRLPREAPPANRDVRRTFRLLLPRVAGQSAVQLSTIVTFTLAAGLGDGRPAAYRYAFTLFVLPIGLFGTSIATVTFPAMSREAVEQDAEGFLYLVRRAIRGVLFFIIPAGLGLIALRYPIIEMIYERGEFDNRAAALVAEPLLYFAAGIWAYALVDVLPRAFYALQDSITPLKIAAVAVVLDVALSLLLSRLMGLGGLALAFSAATGLQVILLARALRSHVGPIVNASMWDYFYRLAIASSSMVFALYLAQPVLSEYQALALPGLVLRVGLVVGGSAAVYIFISYLLGQDEVGVLARLARRIT